MLFIIPLMQWMIQIAILLIFGFTAIICQAYNVPDKIKRLKGIFSSNDKQINNIHAFNLINLLMATILIIALSLINAFYVKL
jgi:hypothetical protein